MASDMRVRTYMLSPPSRSIRRTALITPHTLPTYSLPIFLFRTPLCVRIWIYVPKAIVLSLVHNHFLFVYSSLTVSLRLKSLPEFRLRFNFQHNPCSFTFIIAFLAVWVRRTQ